MGQLSDSDFEGFEPPDWDSLLDKRDYIYTLIDNVEWDAQLRAIRLLLGRNRKAREEASDFIERDEEELKSYKGPHHDHYVDQHVDLIHDSVYENAAESMAAIGMIAPMVESILCQALAALGQLYLEKNMTPPAHKRWKRADKSACTWEVRWNGQFYLNDENEAKNNIPLGFPQLAAACGLDRYLPADFMTWFQAMFKYRNAMFHGGFEWSLESRRKFSDLVDKHGWQQFFTCSTTGGEPWIYYLTNETIEDMPNRVGNMLDALGEFAKNLPFELISEG